MTNDVTKLWWRSPDLFLKYFYSTEIDIWSIGCIFFELLNISPLTHKVGPLFYRMLPENPETVIFEILGYPSNTFSPQFCLIIKDINIIKGKQIDEKQRKIDIKDRLFKKKLYFKDNYKNVFGTSFAMDLLVQFLRYDGNKRITAKDAMNDLFFVSDKFVVYGFIRKIQFEFNIYVPLSIMEVVISYYLYIADQYQVLREAYKKYKY